MLRTGGICLVSSVAGAGLAYYYCHSSNKSIPEKTTKLTSLSKNSVNLLEDIQNLSDEKIIQHHHNICKYTKSNIGEVYDKPIYCGTSANAVLDYMKERTGFDTLTREGLPRTINILTNSTTPELTTFRVSISACNAYLQSNSWTYFWDWLKGKNKRFCGHAFVIIKIEPPYYLLLQSYVDNYKVENIPKRVKIVYNKDQLVSLLLELIQFENKFDNGFVETWKMLTGIDISHLNGYNIDTSFEVHYINR